MAAPAILAALGKGLSSTAAVGGSASAVTGLYPPLSELMSQQAWSSWPNRIPSLADALALRRAGIIPASQFKEWCNKNGFDIQISDDLLESTASLLTPLDYVALWRRSKLSESELNKYLERLGYPATEIPKLLLASEIQPNPSDVVRFAVREAYSPKTVADYGLDQDTPDEYIEGAKATGLSEEFAKLYWRAHWELPSISQANEMLHRGVITEQIHSELLRAQDVMPYWRDKLKAISYNPLTRVDIRRVYNMGLLDETGVFKAYKDGGYNDENARLLTQYVVKDFGNDDTGLTRESVIRAYKNGIIQAGEFDDYLSRLGYSADIIAFYRRSAEYDKLVQSLDDDVIELSAQYELGLIDESGIRDRLSALKAPEQFVETTVAKILRKEAGKRKLPARTDLERWFEKQIIGEQEYFEGMVALGYSRRHSQLYMQEIIQDAEEPTVKRMPIGTYMRWLKKGIMSHNEFQRSLVETGYTTDDINRAIAEVGQSGAK